MTQLIPCPGCNRHVRQAETSCPFCATALSLGHVAPAPMPRTRLGRAATFAFGATLVGATTLLACGGESEEKKPGGGGSSSGGTSSGGTNSSAGDQNFGGTGVGPVYGAPAAGSNAIYGGPPIGGTGSEGGSGSSAGNTSGGTSVGGSGGPAPAYGAPAAGFSGIPLYGAAPAD